MKRFSFRMALVVSVLCGVIAVCSSSAAAQDAAATYKAKCAMCHGPDGKGGKMGTRDFASAEVKAETDAQLTDIITKGKGKTGVRKQVERHGHQGPGCLHSQPG